MFSYRITKYNPEFRNETGTFLKDDWISIAQIGSTFEGKLLTPEEYLRVEDAYVQAVILFMEFLKLPTISVTFLKKCTYNSPVPLTNSMKKVYKKVHLGMLATKEEVADMVHLDLRGQLGCRLESPEMFVHFGWDYYMYVGSIKKAPLSLIEKIEKSGLLVEEFESPYHPDPDDMN